MRLPAWLPLCLLLPACASTSSLPFGETWISDGTALPAAVVAAEDGWGYGGDTWNTEAPSAQGWARPGAYIAVNGVFGQETVETPEGWGDLDPMTSSGAGIRAGYRVADTVAIELAWNTLSFSGTSTEASTTGYYSITVTTVSVDAKWSELLAQGRFFLSKEQYQPYFLLGLGTIIPEDGDSGTAIRLGFGVDAYITPNFGVFGDLIAEFQNFSGNGGSATHRGTALEIGAFYRF